MLVLSRRPNESVHIDSEIQVTVLSIKNGHVRLGFSAPDHVKILRNELLDHRPDAAARHEEAGPEQARSR